MFLRIRVTFGIVYQMEKRDFMREHGIFWGRGPRAGMKVVFPQGQSFGMTVGSSGMIDFGVDFILKEKSEFYT